MAKPGPVSDQKAVEFRSVAPYHCIHVDELEKKVGANRTVRQLKAIRFEPVGGRQEDFHKNGGRYITADPDEIAFLRQHTGLGRAYRETAGKTVSFQDELAGLVKPKA